MKEQFHTVLLNNSGMNYYSDNTATRFVTATSADTLARLVGGGLDRKKSPTDFSTRFVREREKTRVGEALS